MQLKSPSLLSSFLNWNILDFYKKGFTFYGTIENISLGKMLNLDDSILEASLLYNYTKFTRGGVNVKTFYHCLSMWIPFGILFTFAGLGLELIEGKKITTTEYWGIYDLKIIYLFLIGSVTFILYIFSFMPVTFVVSKFIESLRFKVVIFTFFGGVVGVFALKILYGARLIEEYHLNFYSAIIIFGLAGFLYALVEMLISKKIQFL